MIFLHGLAYGFLGGLPIYAAYYEGSYWGSTKTESIILAGKLASAETAGSPYESSTLVLNPKP